MLHFEVHGGEFAVIFGLIFTHFGFIFSCLFKHFDFDFYVVYIAKGHAQILSPTTTYRPDPHFHLGKSRQKQHVQWTQQASMCFFRSIIMLFFEDQSSALTCYTIARPSLYNACCSLDIDIQGNIAMRRYPACYCNSINFS